MPVVDRDTEIQIVLEGRKLGKSDEEIKNRVRQFRTQTLEAQGKKADAQPGILAGAAGKIGEQARGIKPAVSEAFARGREQTPFQQLTAPLRGAVGLVRGAAERVGSAGEAAVETVGAAPEAFRTAVRGVTPGVEPKPEDIAELQRVTGLQREAVTGVAEFIPTPAAQFAAGLAGGQQEGVEQGLAPREALGRGLAVGVERGLVAGTTQKLARGAKTRQTAKVEAFEERVAPKFTLKERKLATAEQRVSRPKTGKLKEFLFGRKKDVVKSSERTKQVAKTVKREVAGAERLDDFELQNSLQDRATQITSDLKPELQKVKFTPKDTKGLLDDAKQLRKTQKAELSAIDAKVGTIHKDFQVILDKLTQKVKGKKGEFRAKNLDDAWEIAKSYDKTIPDNIKNATITSSDILKAKQTAWLQNRRLLRDFIKGNSKEAKQGFSTLHDLLTASENIIQRAPLELKGTTGVLTPGNVGRKILGAAGVGAVGKFLLD